MNALATYLKVKSLRQHDFAGRVGATQSTISKLSAGEVKPSLELAIAIERATSGAVPATSWISEHPAETATPQAKDAA